MEFAKIYDTKINEELKKYETLQWEMYYGHCFQSVCSSLNRNISEIPKTKNRQ